MDEILRNITSSNTNLLPVVTFLFCFVFASILAIMLFGWSLWLKHRRDEIHTELKQEMLARGMSADEIIQVLNAGDPKKSTKSQRVGKM